MNLEKLLGRIGFVSIPARVPEDTPFRREIYKILYTIGAVTFAPDYVREPINWGIIREELQNKVRRYHG